MSAIRSIVYVSTANYLFSASELEQLLASARQLNEKNNVSGLLIYADGNFMQCIEGPEEAMRETYARILASRRHRGIVELMNEVVTQRSFGEWSMALAQAPRSELLALTTANWEQMARSRQTGWLESPGFALLQGFWERFRT